jgi:hypothetical protein
MNTIRAGFRDCCKSFFGTMVIVVTCYVFMVTHFNFYNFLVGFELVSTKQKWH